jgi:hypothetical protein
VLMPEVDLTVNARGGPMPEAELSVGINIKVHL